MELGKCQELLRLATSPSSSGVTVFCRPQWREPWWHWRRESLLGQVSETPKHRGCLKWQREIGSTSVWKILTCNIRTRVFSDNCYLVTVVNITTSPSQRFGVWNRWISCWLSQASWRPWSSPVVFTLSRISSLLGGLPKDNELGMLAVSRVCAIDIYVNLPYFCGLPSFG